MQDDHWTLFSCKVENHKQVVKLVKQTAAEPSETSAGGPESFDKVKAGKPKLKSTRTTAECEQRMKQGLCLKCGASNCLAANYGAPR